LVGSFHHKPYTRKLENYNGFIIKILG